ncbi:MAG: hypothetical protein RL641_761 [Candidatus Parcubacteria bacterium]
MLTENSASQIFAIIPATKILAKKRKQSTKQNQIVLAFNNLSLEIETLLQNNREIEVIKRVISLQF